MRNQRREAVAYYLLQIVDGSMAGIIFLVPLLMGGRHAIGELTLTVLVVAAAWAWAVRQCLCRDVPWRSTWATPLILAGLSLVAIQIVPLSPSALAWLASRTTEILPLWNTTAAGPAAIGSWSYLSLAPAETRAGLVLFLDFVLLFFVAVQRIQRIEDVERLLRWCALSAVCMAVFGIVQLLTSNGKFFWFYQHPFSNASDGAKGSFSNRNHFAHFLALGIGPLIWWLQDTLRRTSAQTMAAPTKFGRNPHSINNRNADLKTYLLGLALGIVLFAGLLSLSRGGISVMFLAVAISTAIGYWMSSVSGRFVAALAVVGLLLGASLAIFGYDRVSHRLEQIPSVSLDGLNREVARTTIWAAAAKAVPDHPWLGTGVGSFRDVYPMYTDAVRDEDLEYTNAESCYLQIPVETGLTGLALTLAVVGLVAWWCFRGIQPARATRVRMCAAAIAASLAAAAAHALVDFVWYVPACMAIVAILAACALRVQSPIPNPSPVSRPTFPVPFFWPALAAILTLLGGWMVGVGVGPALAQPYWDDYLFARRMAQTQSPAAFADIELQRRWIASLENVIRWQPTHVRAHLALAETHRRLFDAMQINSPNPMSLANIRDAAIQSQFPSRTALVTWLSRAIGKHWAHLDRALYHTQKAIELSPLQGRAYVYLADLSFLRGGDAASKRACIQQAVCVRPFDGAVLYAAGSEALLAGDTTRWLDYTKQAFRHSQRQQQQLIGDLVANTPTENLPGLIDFIVREFRPDLGQLRFLHSLCTQRCPAEQLTPLVRYRIQQAEVEAPGLGKIAAAGVWLEAQQLNSQLGNEAESLRCARNAVECDPGNFNAHQQLAICLLKERSFVEAESHLRWCLQRMPNNQGVQMRLREALKGRLDGQRSATAEIPKTR